MCELSCHSLVLRDDILKLLKLLRQQSTFLDMLDNQLLFESPRFFYFYPHRLQILFKQCNIATSLFVFSQRDSVLCLQCFDLSFKSAFDFLEVTIESDVVLVKLFV